MLTRTTRLAALLLAAAATIPATASAVQVEAFVSPDGSGTSCTQSAPCALSEAFTRTASDPITTVSVGAGTYSVLGEQTAAHAITLAGDPDGPRPVIDFGNGKILGTQGIELTGAGSAVRWLEIHDNRGTPISIESDGTSGGTDETMSEVVAITQGPYAACSETRTTISNSVCRSTAGPGLLDHKVGSEVPETQIKGSTLIGGPAGLQIGTGTGDLGTASMDETIAEATSPGGNDIDQEYTSGTFTLTGQNDYRGAPTTTGQNAAVPTFTDAYHEAPDSLTIDGTSISLIFSGSADVDRRLRLAGDTVDIGASEYRPPTATTAPATGVAQSTATLAGTATSFGSPGKASFELGTTTAYGTTIDAGPSGGADPTPFAATANGLLPGTTYHERAVFTLTSSSGATFPFDGPDVTFTTGPAPADPGSGSSSGGAGGSGSGAGGTSGTGGPGAGGGSTLSQPIAPPLALTLAARGKASKQKVGGGAAVTVTCSVACKLAASLSISARIAKGHGLGKRKGQTPVAIGTISSALTAKGAEPLQIKLSKKALARLRAVRSLSVVVTVVATDAAGHTSTKTLPLTLHH